MANRHSPPPPQAPKRAAAQMRNVISRIERVIRELREFDPTTVRDRSDRRIGSLEASIKQVLTQAFSDESERRLYEAAASLDRAPLTMGAKTPLQEVVQGMTRGKEQAISFLIEQSGPLRIRSPTLEYPKSPPSIPPSFLKTCSSSMVMMTRRRWRLPV